MLNISFETFSRLKPFSIDATFLQISIVLVVWGVVVALGYSDVQLSEEIHSA